MNPILAEASNQFLGEFVYALLAISGGVVAVVTIWALTKKKSSVHIEPQPVEVRKTPKRYNHEQTEARFVEHDRRLDEHGEQIESIWRTVREEDAKIREENREQFLAISRSLGRIEGRLGVKNAPES